MRMLRERLETATSEVLTYLEKHLPRSNGLWTEICTSQTIQFISCEIENDTVLQNGSAKHTFVGSGLSLLILTIQYHANFPFNRLEYGLTIQVKKSTKVSDLEFKSFTYFML